MRRFFTGILCTLAFFAAGVVNAQNQPQGPIANAFAPEIATSAWGSVRLTADRAYVNFSIETRDGSAAEAGKQNSQRTVALIDALKNAGITQSDIVTSGYTVSQSYESDRKSASRPSGFIAQNSIRVTVAKVENVGRIIDAGLAGGAMQVSVTQLGPVDSNDARRRALALAVADARIDAQAMAVAAGGSLGRLISVSSFSSPAPMMRDMMNQAVITGTASGGYNGPTPFTAREIIISANALCRWEFVLGLK